jgi:preprotein translocase subunit SecG
MAVSPLLAVSFIMNVIAAIFIISAVTLILAVLIQKGKGGGLGGAFGAGMASGILGSKTGDFLTWFTIALVGLFLTLGVIMAKFYKPSISDFGEGQAVQQSQPVEQSQPLASVVPGDTNTDANSLGE